MSAFFIVPTAQAPLINVAERVFEKRGIRGGRHFTLSCGELLLYPKQMLDVENFKANDKGSIFCIGTPVYKGLSYDESQKQMLDDFQQGKLQTELLLGEYVLIFDVGGRVSVLTDATGMYKLFTDLDSRFVTSSFMAAAACTAHTINHLAVAEQMLYGFVGAPDTLVNEVVCLKNPKEKASVSWIQWLGHEQHPNLKRSKTKAESVKRQHDAISEYLKGVRALVHEFGGECGMSGGNDSRLVYASVNAACEPLKSVHTHCTSNVHNKEINVVKKVVGILGTPLNMVPTTYISDCDGDTINETLRENVMYFDARNAENIGAFSQTHTQWYKKAAANGNGVTFSGIAGEIYRDFYHTKVPRFGFNRWLESRVFAKGIKSMIPCGLYDGAMRRITEKVQTETGLDLQKKTNPIVAKRFFDCYRIPNALSNVVHANNQMSFYLAPFTESMLIRTAKPDGCWHEHCGEYEGKITTAFMPNVAAIPGSNGYPLSDVPHKDLLKWYMLSRLPFALWDKKTKSDKGNSSNAKRLEQVLEKSTYLQSAMRCFNSIFPDWNMDSATRGCVLLNNYIFTICAVYEITML